MRYAYPAVFEKEKEGGYSIFFPDIENCFTCGESIAEGMAMAEDVLALTLYSAYEEIDIPVPEASSSENMKVRKGSFATYVYCDTLEYRKMYRNKAVKKTLSIPEYMNEAAMKAGLSLSQVLQDALKEKLHLA